MRCKSLTTTCTKSSAKRAPGTPLLLTVLKQTGPTIYSYVSKASFYSSHLSGAPPLLLFSITTTKVNALEHLLLNSLLENVQRTRKTQTCKGRVKVLTLFKMVYLSAVNPPAPVDCPIAGRYQFSQIGSEPEKYRTRVEGITQRPRHQIDCRQFESEFKSCADNTKKIQVDIEYCATLDHTGRPIGEYGMFMHIQR